MPVTQQPDVAAETKILTCKRSNALAVANGTKVEANIILLVGATYAKEATHFVEEIDQDLPPQVNATVGAEVQVYE